VARATRLVRCTQGRAMERQHEGGVGTEMGEGWAMEPLLPRLSGEPCTLRSVRSGGRADGVNQGVGRSERQEV
jgi:hypothetical protein